MIKFGTDGWRAIIADEFTFENVKKVAVAHAKVLMEQNKKRVIIGYDYRFMSEYFAIEVYKVFRNFGLDAYLTQSFSTTPMVSFAVKYMGFDNGVMITASHNPPHYNGYKIKDSFGGAATPDFIGKVENHINTLQSLPSLENYAPQYVSVEEEYIKKVREMVNIEILKERELKIVHDAMYGTSSGLLSKALYDTKCQVFQIRSYRDTLFGNHAPEPVEKNLKPLIEKVNSLSADIGIANDGDGDRIALIDEKGNFVNAQLIYVLLLLHLIKHKGIRDGIVVKTVSTTYLADRICKSESIPIKEVAVGFKNINEVLLKEKVIFGGEESGGYGIVHFLPERDGLLSALYIIEMINLLGKPLSEVIQDIFKTYGEAHFKRVDLHAQEDKKRKIKELIQNPPERIGSFKVDKVITLDGIKLVFPNDGWLLLRPSGTEPLVRIYTEMPSQKETDEILESAFKLLE